MEQLLFVQINYVIKEIISSMIEVLNEEFKAGIYNKQMLCCVFGFVEYLIVIIKFDLQIILRDGKFFFVADIVIKV